MSPLAAFSFFAAISGGLICSDAKQLPSFIEKCSLSDKANLGKCLVQRVKDVQPRLLQGIPELKLPPIEPLRIPKLELHTGTGATVSFDATVTDIEVYGVKNLEVSQMDMDFESKIMLVQHWNPHLIIQGTYTVNGKILLFDINATGALETNITNVKTKAMLPFKIVTKNGKEYMEISNSDYKLDITYEKISIYFHNIIKDNPQLTKEINKAINDNIESLSKEVNPLVFQSSHLLVLGIVNTIFINYSIDELFAH